MYMTVVNFHLYTKLAVVNSTVWIKEIQAVQLDVTVIRGPPD